MMTPEDFFAHEQAQLEPVLVTYLVQMGARVVVVENVPAQVNRLTGEQLFSSETTERLLQIAQGQASVPVRLTEAAVYSFAA